MAEFRERLGQLEHLLLDADRLTDALEARAAAAAPSTAADEAAADTATHLPTSSHFGYSIGQSLSLADAAYGPLFLYADLILDALGLSLADDWAAGRWPRVSALRLALGKDPHVRQAVAQLEPEARAWVQGKLGA